MQNIWLAIKPSGKHLVIAVGLVLLGSALALVQPYLAGLLTTAVVDKTGAWPLSPSGIILVWMAVLAFLGLAQFAEHVLLGRVGEDIYHRLRVRVFDHLQMLTLRAHRARDTGATLSLIARDAENVSYYITDSVVYLPGNCLRFFVALIMIFLIDPTVAILICLGIPIFVLALRLPGRILRKSSAQLLRSHGGLASFLNENLRSMLLVKSFTREPYEAENFRCRSRTLKAEATKYHTVVALFSLGARFFISIGILLLLAVTVGKVESGQLSASDLVSLVFYGFLLAQPVTGLATAYGESQLARESARRIESLLNEESEVEDTGTRSLPGVLNSICFNRVDFSYPKTGQRVFEDASIRIAAGETVAITGANGAGKTSLTSLLMRFYTLDQGDITIDGISITEFRLNSLRSKIGLVPQDPLVLGSSIYDTIAFSNPQATAEEVKNAARQAHAAHFIEALPDGYLSKIGEGGCLLSGGQKQRLALARVFLKNPPIIILDEATSMFDPAGEQQFVRECREHFRDRTVLLITHRPASLALADRVLSLSNGKIVDISGQPRSHDRRDLFQSA